MSKQNKNAILSIVNRLIDEQIKNGLNYQDLATVHKIIKLSNPIN